LIWLLLLVIEAAACLFNYRTIKHKQALAAEALSRDFCRRAAATGHTQL
jgi:hypothetical protein